MLAIKCVVSRPDGSLVKREENEWGGLDDEAITDFRSRLLAFADRVKKEEGKKDDDANLTAVLSGSVKGEEVPTITVTNISLKSHFKLEREWDREREVLDRIQEKALRKAAK